MRTATSQPLARELTGELLELTEPITDADFCPIHFMPLENGETCWDCAGAKWFAEDNTTHIAQTNNTDTRSHGP